MNVKLYGIPGSHPVMSAQLMLEHKGIPYKRVDFFPLVHRPLVRMLGFAGNRVWGARRLNDSYDPTVERMLASLPESLDRIDRWIADGVLNGDELNAADFGIASSLRLLMCHEDIAPSISARPAGALAQRVVPREPGHIRAVFPPEWLEPLRVATPA